MIATSDSNGLVLANHGTSAALGCFRAQTPLVLGRGERVVLQTLRGLEIGTVLRAASKEHIAILGPVGVLLRKMSPDDEAALQRLKSQQQELYAAAQKHIANLGLNVALLDVEVLLDAGNAILQVLGPEDFDPSPLVEALEARFDLDIRCENLALVPQHSAEQDLGCGKPDCGKTEGGSGCSSSGCSSGSCGTCGSSKESPDISPYFAHLRTKIDGERTPLL